MNKSFLFLLAAAMTLAACQKTEISAPSTEGATLSATIEDVASTKTYIDEDNNICWNAWDEVIAFMKSSYGQRYAIVESYAGKTYAEFTKVGTDDEDQSAGQDLSHNVVFYPYSKNIECVQSDSEYILNSVSLPNWQTNYALESISNDMPFPMVAVSEDSNITFRNVCGGIKLQLKGDVEVKIITIEGKNGEKLSGEATVTAYSNGADPVIEMSSTASEVVTSYYAYGIQLAQDNVTEFIIMLPPVVFTEGFVITVTDSEAFEYILESDKTNTVYRSSLLVMPEVELFKPVLRDYVDEFNVNHGEGVKISGTIWAPVNCGYHETDYPYGKLYQWGRKYGQGYSGSVYDGNGDVIENHYDATVPVMQSGGVSKLIGNEDYCNNIFFTAGADLNFDWINSQNGALWNSGTEENPVKTEYDPCPAGWRVPTYAELEGLMQNYSSWTSEGGQTGRWFSGPNPYSEAVPQVFFPAAGFRRYDGIASYRGYYGDYWPSRTFNNDAYSLTFSQGSVNMGYGGRAYGCSVRCVQVID